MTLRGIIPTLIACSWLSSSAVQEVSLPRVFPTTPAHPQDFNETVVPITVLKIGLRDDRSRVASGPSVKSLLKPSLKSSAKSSLNTLSNFDLESKVGTGFCLDPECRFIGTNYHVAMMAQPRKIKGEKVIQQYLATGPNDEGATMNEVPFVHPMKYSLSRDLAIFELRHPLPHHHGAAFSLDDLQVGQEVDIYAYPEEGANPIRRRSLLKFHGTFKGEMTNGLLVFAYSQFADKAICPGASGGVVVDSRTQQIVGILNAMAKNDEAIVTAVPVQSLAEFVNNVQPWLARSIFPSTEAIPPGSADFHPQFVSPPADVLQHRPEETGEVKLLREKAQLLADSMRNFIAIQTFEWGVGDKDPAAVAAYEVRVIDGAQRFREYPDGKKVFQDVPLSQVNTGVGTGGEWSELPQMVGTAPRFKIHQFPDTVVNGRRIKVFQYRAEVEDGICVFKSTTDFLLFAVNKIVTVPCYGEVWTDEHTDILRISEHLELAGVAWRDYQSVVTYGWLKRANEPLRLIPVTISAQAKYKKKIYWCRGQFTDYQVFSVRVKIGASR